MASSGSQRQVKINISEVLQAVGSGGAAAEEQKRQNSLPICYDVMRYDLFSQMDTKSLAAFANISFYSQKRAQPELNRRAMKKLFEHIREGEIDKVKKMLAARPHLALITWQGTTVFANKAGQLISVEGKTAYEFALGEEDTEIAAELRACIVKVTKNEDIANTLFDKQRPAGWEEEEAKQSAPIFTQLDVLTEVIRNAAPGDIVSSGDPVYRLTVREGSAVSDALLKFRSMLDATLKETITVGRHFNPNLLLRAFQIYDAHYEDYFGNDWSNPRALLFWQQVIGYVQRFMPANYVQAFCDGLYKTNEKLQRGESQGRSLKLEIYHPRVGWVSSDFYPLVESRLGFNFAIYASPTGALALRPVGAGRRRGDLSKLMSIKNSRLTELAPPRRDCRSKSTKSFCVIT